jgi:hypothetical protein
MEEQKATKVTLYLPHDLHRQLKIRSAVEGEAMSSIAKRAIDFYLANSDAVRAAHHLWCCVRTNWLQLLRLPVHPRAAP